MKTIKKISILFTIILSSIISFSDASELSLQPTNWSYSPWCMLWIDIVMDPNWEAISASDIILESSMEFIKFEPTKLFPYFFPARTSGNVTHIIWFTALWPSQRIKEWWIIWKVYFKPKDKLNKDWLIRFVFKWKWDTTDTNLSLWWGIDSLEKQPQDWLYKFNWTNCEYLEEDIDNLDFSEWVHQIANKITKDHNNQLLSQSRENNKSYIISLFILIVIIVIYFKVSKWKSKKK